MSERNRNALIQEVSLSHPPRSPFLFFLSDGKPSSTTDTLREPLHLR